MSEEETTQEVELDTFDGDEGESQVDTFEDPQIEGDDKVSQVEQIGETDGKEKEGEEDSESDDEEGDEGDVEESSEGTEEESEEKELDADTPIKVKIDGEEVEVSLQELKNAYSGEKAVEKRFNELNREKRKISREFEKKEQSINQIRQELGQHLDTITNLLDDPRRNPLEALYYLVDLKGGNTVEYEKRLMSILENQFEDFSMMDDVERELYWTKKEKEFLARKKESINSRAEQEQANRNSQQELEKIWETHNISEDDFYDARDELVEMGYDASKIEPENVVNYLALKPIYEKAESIAEPYMEELGEDGEQLMDEIAKAIQNFPNLDEQELLTIAAKNMGLEVEVEDDFEREISRKIPQSKTKRGKKRVSEYDLDTF